MSPAADLRDRVEEQRALAVAWETASSGTPQLVLVTGKRRVGKTFLLAAFARERRAVTFTATRQSEGAELRRFAEAASETEAGRAMLRTAGGTFRNWEHVLRSLAVAAEGDPLLVVIDEAPYLEESTPGFASLVQATWDAIAVGGQSRLMLVLTGSAIATMDALASGRGPLYGRTTQRLRVRPVDIVDAGEFVDGLRPSQLIEAYAACGGYPLHLRAWDPEKTTEANLLRLAFTPGSLLLEDASQLLREGLPGAGGYERVLTAIGRGATKYSEIGNEADQRVDYTLRMLEAAGFVAKETPVGAPPRARGAFRIDDTYLAFWFSTLDPVRAAIESGQGPAALARVAHRWQRHVAWTFEELCRRHAIRLIGAGELPPMVIGRWWSTSGQPVEIDVVGLGDATTLVGEVKWSDEVDMARLLHELERKAASVARPADRLRLAVWSRRRTDATSDALQFDASDVIER
jgi:AAA+ ATPase superfamily predicted ATPase